MCKNRAMHRVAVLALDGVIPFELSIPSRIFGGAYTPDGRPRYEVVTCSLDGRPVATAADYSVLVEHDTAVLATADTVVIPAVEDFSDITGPEELPAGLLTALTSVRPGTRVVSICVASFVLAAAGLLDGRPATTHWQQAERLARLYPQVRVDPGVLFVDDGDVLTSAGAAAGVDLCLHLLRRDHGSEVANQVARRAWWRRGGTAARRSTSSTPCPSRPPPERPPPGRGPWSGWASRSSWRTWRGTPA